MLRTLLPEPAKTLLRPIRNRLIPKTGAEIDFWRGRRALDDGRFQNGHYERLMLAMAGEPDSTFVSGKVVADFGCGPRGSLVWATDAALRIGIDVLADRYCDEFTSDVLSHTMVYLKSTEKVIPLPDRLVDVMFTLNAIDHVDDFPRMCSEILRVIRRGGLFVGSFNLEEPAGPAEPQRLDERLIRDHLLGHLEVQSYRLTAKANEGETYAPFFGELLPYRQGEEGYLWVRAVKP